MKGKKVRNKKKEKPSENDKHIIFFFWKFCVNQCQMCCYHLVVFAVQSILNSFGLFVGSIVLHGQRVHGTKIVFPFLDDY